MVEPTTRIEPQIRELRPGPILPLKEKKVKYSSTRGYPPNCLPLPTVWYNRWLCLNPSTTFLHPLLGSRETCNSCLQKAPFPCCLSFLPFCDSAGDHSLNISGLSLHKMKPLKRCCVFCASGPDNDVFCATDLIIACLFLQINKDLGTVLYRQLNRLVSFFNYMSSCKINKEYFSNDWQLRETS